MFILLLIALQGSFVTATVEGMFQTHIECADAQQYYVSEHPDSKPTAVCVYIKPA
jgi:hypothetical protein